jgi:NAD(P)-dependent dehydrogenase (short-subunit alcohol dehydrogenase family)
MTQSYVVIGAYGGVGEVLCRRLVQGGAHVLMAGRRDRVGHRLAARHGAGLGDGPGHWRGRRSLSGALAFLTRHSLARVASARRAATRPADV